MPNDEFYQCAKSWAYPPDQWRNAKLQDEGVSTSILAMPELVGWCARGAYCLQRAAGH